MDNNKLYNDLLEVINPYLDDFTGYDETTQSFNIVLAIKELLESMSDNQEVGIITNKGEN